MAITIQTALLNKLRQHVVDVVDHAQYTEGGETRTARIEAKTVRENGNIQIEFYVRRIDGSSTAEDFELCDSNGNALVSQDDTVTFAGSVNEMLYRFRLSVTEAAFSDSEE